MANRLGYVFLLTALTSGVLVTACGDDDAIDGGEAGAPGASGSPGDAGSGSSVAGSSGSGQGGTGGTEPLGGAGNGGEPATGGTAGGGGTAGSGGTAGGGGTAGADGGMGGEAGAGGASNPGLDYACGQTSIAHTYCSAAAAFPCSNHMECPDCVAQVNMERGDFADCATCLAEYDKGYQCAIDAFEAGNAAEGLQCFDGDGVYISDACFELQDSAIACEAYAAEFDCPAQWPIP